MPSVWEKPGLACAVLLAGNLFMVMSALAGEGRSAGEISLRQSLGIPAEAKEVIVFAQSSHVDPDWLMTADQYQRLLTDKTFDQALVELEKDPRYVYSVECIFFFKRYWDSHPGRQETLRNYVNQGRIRFTGAGVTTPDTLLPEAENILRDYLIGLGWLKQQGMNIDPKLAYFPDDFGHSPTVPSILRELGYRYAAIGRIDGKYTMVADYRPAGQYPLPGSNAELMYEQLKTLDFIWLGPDGAEVLTHVSGSGTNYSAGDMIAHTGSINMYGVYLGLPVRAGSLTNKRIDSYVRELKQLSLTGYMFCSIGGDFNPPVPDLNRILDHYNQTRYPETGVYAVLAGLEDYMQLIAFHKDKLPQMKFDPNPYWTGFYSSRPGLKQQCRRLSRSLFLAETLGIMAEDKGLADYPDLARPWYISAMSNHHDFITGTSRDKVLNQEQIPLLKESQALVDKEIATLGAKLNLVPAASPPPMNWKLEAGVLKAENSFYELELDAGQGGCITRWYDRINHREVLAGPSNDILLYSENGGLYSMGMELFHGRFQEIGRAGNSAAAVDAQEKNGELVVTVESKFAGHDFVRTLFLRSDSPVVRMRMKGAVKRERTATVCFRPALAPGRFIQEVPYGVVERPLEKLYSPTFWPVKNWVELRDKSDQFGVDLAVAAPGAVTARPSGILEAVALRNTPRERPMGIPAIQTVVANGTDPVEHEFDYAFWPAGQGDWRTRKVFAQAKMALSDARLDPAKPDWETTASSMVKTSRDDVVVTAVKKAESGKGVVVRLFSYAEGPASVRLSYSGKQVKSAVLVNALEQELEQLPVKDGTVELKMTYSLATVLIQF